MKKKKAITTESAADKNSNAVAGHWWQVVIEASTK